MYYVHKICWTVNDPRQIIASVKIFTIEWIHKSKNYFILSFPHYKAEFAFILDFLYFCEICDFDAEVLGCREKRCLEKQK